MRIEHRSAGFTLVEAVVALTLLSLLLTFLFGGLRYGNRIVSVGTGIADRAEAVSIAETFLRNQLSAASPFLMPGAGERPVVAFDGESDRVAFVVLPPAYLALGGFHWMKVGTNGNGADRRLVVGWQPVQSPGKKDAVAPAPGQRISILLENVAGIRLSYYGASDQRQAAVWHDSWRNAASLPLLIRIEATFSDGKSIPPLIVAPRLTAMTIAGH